MEAQKNINNQNNLKKEEQSWRHHTFCSQTIYKATVIKTVWYCHTEKPMYQYNRIKSQKINLGICGWLI